MHSAALVQRYRNLVALPSCHHDATYGRAARALIAREQPHVVALEVPPCHLPELEWGAGCWPVPVASVSRGATIPCVPGDSIVEAFRAARHAGIPVAAVDLDVDEDGPLARQPLPGAELGTRVGPAFTEVASAIAAQQPQSEAGLAREAAMARELAGLMARFTSVLWVGGMAHWARIVQRLEANDFSASPVVCARPRKFTRARLAGSALFRMTGQWPWRVARFAADPDGFDPVDAGRQMLHQATRPVRRRQAAPHPSPTPATSPHGVMDVARTALYARNLAATRGVRESPALDELLLAAKSTIGDEYAARVHALAMHDTVTKATRTLPALTWEVADNGRTAGFRLNGRWVYTEPWLPAHRSALAIPLASEVDRVGRDAVYEGLPGPRRGERFYWAAYPPDEAAYEEFVRYILRRASASHEDVGHSVPFTSGLRDGLDVRATIRHWHDDALYLHEARRNHARFTNGVIDWTSSAEDAPILWNRQEGLGGGWNDPDSPHVGSCSREVLPHEVLFSSGDALTTRRHREWSVVTLDCPTFLDRPGGRRTFFDTVIQDLVAIQGTRADNVYSWLETMCRFCAGKPLVYYSLYVPGPELFDIARRHRVRLVWSPLHRIPEALRARHRTFRQLHLSGSQWTELARRLGEGRSGVPAWDRAALTRQA